MSGGPFLPDRWEKLEPLLDAALEREPPERPAFLDRVCAGDSALRAELETLLAECAHSDRLFAVGAVERFAGLLTGPPRQLPEMVAGRYRVEREIGAGGMATVYLAHDVKHDRDVALKVLRADLAAVIGAKRFLAEVRITARLEHPHILTLIDSGEADGILFYVLSYVRGESLRAKLSRERQLSIPDALTITRQIAAALDYAHAQGVVHRDVKPENILLHEGEAMLVDFGIALAVEEAGGSRLTETGLSLGTPQYMSPEQATGDRVLDARSDTYSLAAVLYEMIAGEPPVTGATKQAIIAKLLTERPTKLRVVRDTVPESVDHAVDKALSKVPADRFATAGAFARALDAAVATTIPRRRRSNRAMVAALAGAAIIALVAVLSWGRIGGGPHAGVLLTDRRQITFSGHVALPTISGDGKTLAYQTTNCGPAGCTFGIELQDVSGAASPRRLVDGASAIHRIEWSPDRHNLLFTGTFNPVFGTYLVSAALGGAPRRVPIGATFFAGGDSLLFKGTGEHWLFVSGLDGVPHDSIQVGDPGNRLAFFGAVPGSQWIVVGVVRGLVARSSWEAHVIGRDGRVSSQIVVGHVGTRPEARASSDALWVSPGGEGWPQRAVLRIPLDVASGRFSSSIDTLSTGVHTGFSVTTDGSDLVLDEGTTGFGLWGVSVSEAVHGVFPEQKRLVKSTSALDGRLSPDGKRVLVGHDVGKAADGLQRWSAISFDGPVDVETPLTFAGKTADAIWSDSATFAIRDRMPEGSRLALVDVETGARRDPLDVRDLFPQLRAHLPGGGWIWLAGLPPALRVQRPHDASPRPLPLPVWFRGWFALEISGDGRFVAVGGWKAPNQDSLRVSMISLADGTVTPWFTASGESGHLTRLKDGTFLLLLNDTPETVSLHHLLGPGRTEHLGVIPRTVSSLSVSEDLKRAAVVVRDHQGDAWISRVVRR